MPYSIEVDDRGIVAIEHTGVLTVVEATESRDEAAELMRKRGLFLVLADVSKTDHETETLNLFEFNASHYEVFPKGSRLAVVIPPQPEVQEHALFAETVARNRGVIMKLFLDRDAAIAWLKSV